MEQRNAQGNKLYMHNVTASVMCSVGSALDAQEIPH